MTRATKLKVDAKIGTPIFHGGRRWRIIQTKRERKKERKNERTNERKTPNAQKYAQNYKQIGTHEKKKKKTHKTKPK
jgi:hypothetical protein